MRRPVQIERMNPDLLMGEELLKKTGAGNLFTVFGTTARVSLYVTPTSPAPTSLTRS